MAWLCFFIPKFSKKRYKMEDFHPLRGKSKAINIFKLNKRIDEVRKGMVKSLTNEEIDALWEKRKEKEKKDGSRRKR